MLTCSQFLVDGTPVKIATGLASSKPYASVLVRSEYDILVGPPGVTDANGFLLAGVNFSSTPIALYPGDELWARTKAGTGLHTVWVLYSGL